MPDKLYPATHAESVWLAFLPSSLSNRFASAVTSSDKDELGKSVIKTTNKKERILSPVLSLSFNKIHVNINLLLTEPLILPESIHVIISNF